MEKVISYDNPSEGDFEQFRSGLLSQLPFEPTTDPGFVRPAEKLHFVVRQSGEMIAKLRQIVDLYDRLRVAVSTGQGILDEKKSYMDAVKSFAIAVPSVRDIDLGAIASLSAQERAHLREKREQETQLQQEAGNLFSQFVPLWVDPARLQVACSISQVQAAQVWRFLEQSGNAVVKGTQQLFHAQGPPSSLGELFSDGIDELASEVGLGAVTPVMHIFKAIFGFIRQRQIIDDKIETASANFELNLFLLKYFAWWTEGEGSSTIESIVEECAKRQRSHAEAAIEFNGKATQFVEDLEQFSQKISRLQSGQQHAA